MLTIGAAIAEEFTSLHGYKTSDTDVKHYCPFGTQRRMIKTF